MLTRDVLVGGPLASLLYFGVANLAGEASGRLFILAPICASYQKEVLVVAHFPHLYDWCQATVSTHGLLGSYLDKSG